MVLYWGIQFPAYQYDIIFQDTKYKLSSERTIKILKAIAVTSSYGIYVPTFGHILKSRNEVIEKKFGLKDIDTEECLIELHPFILIQDG